MSLASCGPAVDACVLTPALPLQGAFSVVRARRTDALPLSANTVAPVKVDFTSSITGFGLSLRKLSTSEIQVAQAGTYEISFVVNVTAGSSATTFQAAVGASAGTAPFIKSSVATTVTGVLTATFTQSYSVGDIIYLSLQSSTAASADSCLLNITQVSGQTLTGL